MMNARPLLLGHRGARAVKSIPENTPASFDRALADGCDGFEFDVRLTADGKAVVCHDATVGGMEIKAATANQLKSLPEFEEVVQRYKDSAFLDIELKVGGLEKTTLKILRLHQPTRGFVVSSFLPEVLWTLSAEDSAIPLGLICETQAQLDRRRELSVEYVISHHKLVGEDLLPRIKSESRKLWVWTVNSREDMRRFADWGVDGIISDDTKLLCETLGR
jgi:glycerophosphoryl diester phosphodiesterase